MPKHKVQYLILIPLLRLRLLPIAVASNNDATVNIMKIMNAL